MNEKILEIAHKSARNKDSRLLGCGIDDLKRFYQYAQQEALLEAAVLIEGEYYNDNYDTADSVLRSMAEQLDKE